MKTYRNLFSYLICVITVVLASSLSADEEPRGLYVVANVSFFNEDAKIRHGSGVGFGGGAGYQFNKFFLLLNSRGMRHLQSSPRNSMNICNQDQ